MPYNQQDGVVINKPIGITGKAIDLRSQMYEGHEYRDYYSLSEALANLTVPGDPVATTELRKGHFPIFVTSGGISKTYEFRDGQADNNIVEIDSILSTTIPLTTAIPFNQLIKVMATVITAPLTLTVNAGGAIPGYGTILRVTADGINVPNISAFKLLTGSAPYINVPGTVNVYLFFYDGAFFRVSITQDATQALTEQQLYFNRVIQAGGALSDGVKAGIDVFINALKSANIYTKAHEMYFFSGGNAASHVLGFKSSFNGTAVGTLFHSQATGTAGDGVTGFINTGIIPSITLTLNSLCLVLDVLTDDASMAALHCELGVGFANLPSTRLTSLYARNNLGNTEFYSEGSTPIIAANANALGRYIASRFSASQSKLFKNGAQLGVTETASSGILPEGQLTLEAITFNGAPSQFSNRALSFAGIFKGLTDAEVIKLDAALAALKTAIRPAGAYHLESQLYFDRVAAAGGTLTIAIKDGINAFVSTLKANGLFSTAEEFYLFSGGNAASHALGFKGNRNLTFVGTLSHSQTTGTTGDGTTGYAKTGIIPFYSFTLNSVCLAVDVLTNDTATTLMCEVGVIITVPTRGTCLYARRSDGNAEFYAEGAAMVSTATANSQGRMIGSRSSATSSKLFKNGAQIGTTLTTSVDPMPPSEMYAFAINFNDAPTQFSNRHTSFIGMFPGLSDAQVVILDTAMAALKTAIRV